MAINQGSILDHVDKPAIHPDDAVYQSLTPTSDGKVAVTVNGLSITDRVHARGLIAAAGHQSNYLGLQDGLKSGQKVLINNSSSSVSLLVKNSSDSLLLEIDPSDTNMLIWQFTSSSAGSWYGPGSSLSLLDGASTTGALSHIIHGGNKFRIFDDFTQENVSLTTVNDGNWIGFFGSDTDATLAVTIAGAPEGQIAMGSGDGGGANDGSTLSLILLAKGALVSLGGCVMEARVSLDTLAGAVVNVGLSDVLAESAEHSPYKIVAATISDAGLSNTNAAMFVWGTEATAATKWHHVTENATTIAAISTSDNGPVVDTYAILRIEIDADGDARFYVDGTLEKTVTTAVATTSLLIPFIGIDGEDGAPVNTDLTIDYILFEGNRPSSNA
jgi:hypothetical protein